MRWQELWCHHTIVLLAPPSQSHGCIPCAAAAGANEAVAVEARSDVLDRAGRWQSYSQPCGWVLGLGQPLLGIQAMKVMIEWGQMGWLYVGPRDLPTAGIFRLQDADKCTRGNALNSLVDFSVDFFWVQIHIKTYV